MLMHCLNQPLKLFQQNILGSFAQNTIALVPCPVKNSGIMSTSPCWVCVYPLHPLKPTRSPGTWLTTSWCGLVEVVKMTWGSPNTWPGSPIRCIRAIATKRIVISTGCFQMASPARWWKPPWCLAVCWTDSASMGWQDSRRIKVERIQENSHQTALQNSSVYKLYVD